MADERTSRTPGHSTRAIRLPGRFLRYGIAQFRQLRG